MAERKTYKITKTKKKNTKSGDKKSSAKNTKQNRKNGKNNTSKNRDGSERLELVGYRIAPLIFSLVALFLLICMLFPDACGFVGRGVRDLFFGLLSYGFVFIPALLVIMAVFWKKDTVNCTIHRRIIFSSAVLLSFSVLLAEFTRFNRSFSLSELYTHGKSGEGGGVIGGLFDSALGSAVGRPGVLIISVGAFAICFLLLFGLSLQTINDYVTSVASDARDRYDEYVEKRSEKTKKEYTNKPQPHTPTDEFDDGEDVYEYITPDDIVIPENTVVDESFDIDDIGVSDASPTQPDPDDPFEDILASIKLLRPEDGQNTEEVSDTEAPVIPVETNDLFDEPEEAYEDEPETVPYTFPPMTLLPFPKKQKNVDNREELKSNAQKLISTLESFKIKTSLSNISKGPTITRYELIPGPGVRVRQIANLVDDISLSLATQGVRIEAPIPGKSAVGIEVPNRSVATVYLRELLENDKFKESSSLITTALGMDVAGTPIYVDIAKMPHLLIAGATGMGKSVCINSMIISLLYRAAPDQVKLMLIDPKKVELSIYNGLPHLLVPVVSDPKKAAGSLRWACSEMDRRFELIENVGVRDIYNYNKATQNDPDYEFLPHIVIIIDELADLMLTAPDDVEESVCRLAQKARAAGMHLIIGTQRPSVDVITGLIKANIPSRIAFTVASQVDSRTIIDMAGADKLMGRGDMLYAPVGSTKPIRVQGAFVSEHEVESIISFIKSNQGHIHYDDSVIETIEEEAKKCNVGKKGASMSSFSVAEDADGEDAMLRPAIELAIENDKISTSLIQRKLKLGYGRAAKLIDTMESMGIVSEPEGQKPRRVLMTKAQYQEMIAGQAPESDDEE